MKPFFESLRTEDWVVVWVSIPLLLLSALIPALLPNVPRLWPRWTHGATLPCSS